MGAAKDHSRLPRPSGNHLQHTPVVFVPGLKCSILKDGKTGKTAWFTPRMLLLNKRFANLHLPLERDEHGNQLADGIVPHKVVRHVKFGPRTYPIYAPCLQELEDQGRQVYEFPYDWRRDLFETTEKLVAFVEEVSRNHHGMKVQMVTHSMGGIVTLAAVNMRPELFHSCVFGGPPFQPCAPMFIDYINNGRAAGRNTKLLTSRVHFSWASAYGVFPLHGQGIVDSEGNALHYDFFNADTWVREQWGILHPSHPETIVGQPEYDSYIAHLRTALERGKQFQEWIQRRHDITYPPMAVIAGTGHATKVRLMKNGPNAKYGIDADGYPVNHHGDDLIQVDDTHLPAGIPHYHYTTPRAHAFVLSDIAALNHALRQVDVHTRTSEPAHFYPKDATEPHSHAGRHAHSDPEKRSHHHRHHSRPRHGHNHNHAHRAQPHHHSHNHQKPHMTALRAPSNVRSSGRPSLGDGRAEGSTTDVGRDNRHALAQHPEQLSPDASSAQLPGSANGSAPSLPRVDTSSLSELDTTTTPTSPTAKLATTRSLPKMLKKRLSTLSSLSSIGLGGRRTSSGNTSDS